MASQCEMESKTSIVHVLTLLPGGLCRLSLVRRRHQIAYLDCQGLVRCSQEVGASPFLCLTPPMYGYWSDVA